MVKFPGMLSCVGELLSVAELAQAKFSVNVSCTFVFNAATAMLDEAQSLTYVFFKHVECEPVVSSSSDEAKCGLEKYGNRLTVLSVHSEGPDGAISMYHPTLVDNVDADASTVSMLVSSAILGNDWT